MAHSRWPSPLSPMPSMQTLSTTRPVTVAGFPLGACAAAPVAITMTNVPASAPIRLHAPITLLGDDVAPAHEEPRAYGRLFPPCGALPDAAVEEAPEIVESAFRRGGEQAREQGVAGGRSPVPGAHDATQ